MVARGQKRVIGEVFLLFPIRKSCFELLKVHKIEDRKCLMIFLFTFTTINQQTAGMEK